MNIQYREISFVEFTTLDCAILFYEAKTAKRFGVVTNGVKNYKFSWQSDLITPVLVVSDSNTMCYLGVDLMFSVIDFTERASTYTLQLNCFFYDIISIERRIWVITELEILVIDNINHRIVKTISLPSYFKEIISQPPTVTIECLDGEILHLEDD